MAMRGEKKQKKPQSKTLGLLIEMLNATDIRTPNIAPVMTVPQGAFHAPAGLLVVLFPMISSCCFGSVYKAVSILEFYRRVKACTLPEQFLSE